MLSEILKLGTPAAVYMRYSSYKQEEGMSFNIQLNLAQQIIDSYKLNLVNVYKEEHTSGYNTPLKKRAEINRMLDDAFEGKFKVIITMHPDRLSRQVFELIEIRELLDVHKIDLIYSMPGLKQPFEQDILTELLSYQDAMKSSSENSSRSHAALALKASKGEWTGGEPPLGYKLNKQTGLIEVIPEFKQIIEFIYNKYISGISFKRITKLLDPSLSPTGRWTRWQIQGIIKNPCYCGYLAWNKRKSYSNSSWRNPEDWIMVKSKYIPNIIDKKVWDIAQGVLQKKNSSTTPIKNYSSPYLLKGLLKCRCGLELNVKDKRSTHTLRDGTKATYGNKVYYCPNKCSEPLKKDHVEDFIINDLNDLITFTDKDHLLSGIRCNLENKQNEYRELVNGLNERLAKLKEKSKEFSKQIESASKMNLSEEETRNVICCFKDIVSETEKEIKKIESLLRNNKKYLTETNALLKSNKYWEERIISFPNLCRRLEVEEIKYIVKKVYKHIALVDNMNNISISYNIPNYKSKKVNIMQTKLTLH